jgi:hypothetical protein
MHAVGAEQETPRTDRALGVLGVRWTDHLVPFQRSIELGSDPTATQNIGEAHDTPVKEPRRPAGDG